MRRDGPPWWFDFHPSLAMELGNPIAHLVTGLSAYVAATFVRERPRSTWALGTHPQNIDYNEVLLLIDGGRAMSFDGSVLAEATKTFRKPASDRDPDFLLRLYDWFDQPYLDMSGATVAAPFAVGRIDHPDFTHEISIDHVLARAEDDRVERLIEALRASPGVVRAEREDRELILFSAPDLTPASVDRMVSSAWRRTTTP